MLELMRRVHIKNTGLSKSACFKIIISEAGVASGYVASSAAISRTGGIPDI
jgi:hypothetical protein